MSLRLDTVKEQIDAIPTPVKPKLADGATWTNWSNIGGSCNPSHHHYPENVKEVQALVRSISSASGASSMRMAGSGLSPNAATFTEGHLIHTKYMNKILSIDTATRRVRVQPGITLDQLNVALDFHGLMIPVVPSILSQSVGGAIATATHGTGLNTPSLSAFVKGVVLVDAQARVHVVNDTQTELCGVKTNAPIIHGVACHLGLLGLVCEITLQVEAKQMCRVIKRCISVKDLKKVCAQRVMTNDFYRFVWTPYTDYCYETIGRKIAPADEEKASTAAQSVRSVSSVKTSASASPDGGRVALTEGDLRHQKIRAMSRNLKKIPGSVEHEVRTFQDQTKSIAQLLRQNMQTNVVHHALLERALWAATYAPRAQRCINKAYQALYLADTYESLGTPVQTMPVDVLFRQHALEFALDANLALEAFDVVQNLCNKYQGVHFPIEVRFADEEKSWMAPNYGRKTCYIGIVMFIPHGRNAPIQPIIYKDFETSMTKLGGRPHWAKTTTWTVDQYVKHYPLMSKFVQLRKALDPKGLFLNTWAKRIIGDV